MLTSNFRNVHCCDLFLEQSLPSGEPGLKKKSIAMAKIYAFLLQLLDFLNCNKVLWVVSLWPTQSYKHCIFKITDNFGKFFCTDFPKKINEEPYFPLDGFLAFLTTNWLLFFGAICSIWSRCHDFAKLFIFSATGRILGKAYP